MNRNSTRYTFFFALSVCVVCSFLLAAVSEGLRERKERNKALDMKKNILKAVALREPIGPKTPPEEVLRVYAEKISGVVIDAEGNVVEGKNADEIDAESELRALYIYEEDGQVMAYAFPITGKGLWSTLRGYLALEPDAKTVRGITFYDHGETPGLGAEIEKDWFQDNFKGKKIWDDQANELEPVAVVKGKVSEKIKDPKEARHYVDGISGATMTSKGVTEMIARELKVYEPYFSKVRSG